jgi:hypothetical protein
MLMQNFKSAADLEITEPQKDALIKTLVLLETGKLVHSKPEELRPFSPTDEEAPFTGHFNMACWRTKYPCGTVGCIGGTAELVGGCSFDNYEENHALLHLFNPFNQWGDSTWPDITDAQASTALRSYLTTGDACWELALRT